jgi:hypothetical protein
MEFRVNGPENSEKTLRALFAGTPFSVVSVLPSKISDDPLSLILMGRPNSQLEVAYLHSLGLSTFADVQVYELAAAWRLVCMSRHRPNSAANLFRTICDAMHKRQLDFVDIGCGQPLPTHIWQSRFDIRLPIAKGLTDNGVVSENLLKRLGNDDLDFLEDVTESVRRGIRDLRDRLRQ